MEGCVSHGDGPFRGWLADWLIDDPVAMLTDQYDRAFYSTVQLNMSPHSTTYFGIEPSGIAELQSGCTILSHRKCGTVHVQTYDRIP